MKISDWCAEIEKLTKAHDNLVVAVEDFISNPLGQTEGQKLKLALKESKEVQITYE